MSWPAITGLSRIELIPLPEQNVLKQHAAALDHGGEPPDLGSDGTNSRHPPELVRQRSRQAAEDRARDILAQDDQPLDAAQRRADQVTQAIRKAEQTKNAQDRNRQSNQSQHRAKRAGQQVSPGKDTHFVSGPFSVASCRHQIKSDQSLSSPSGQYDRMRRPWEL